MSELLLCNACMYGECAHCWVDVPVSLDEGAAIAGKCQCPYTHEHRTEACVIDDPDHPAFRYDDSDFETWHG